jgi:Ni2+-binding GTPase involved in maturation of urease and hydrogenase
MTEIKILKDILSANDQRAKENRELLDRNDISAINFTASPGAGKTSLILETINRLKRDVLISSVPEGDDKPHKHPVMFSKAHLVVLNKIDLLPHVLFDLPAFTEVVKGLNNGVEIFEVSCKTGQVIERWISWLSNRLDNRPSTS